MHEHPCHELMMGEGAFQLVLKSNWFCDNGEFSSGAMQHGSESEVHGEDDE